MYQHLQSAWPYFCQHGEIEVSARIEALEHVSGERIHHFSRVYCHFIIFTFIYRKHISLYLK